MNGININKMARKIIKISDDEYQIERTYRADKSYFAELLLKAHDYKIAQLYVFGYYKSINKYNKKHSRSIYMVSYMDKISKDYRIAVWEMLGKTTLDNKNSTTLIKQRDYPNNKIIYTGFENYEDFVELQNIYNLSSLPNLYWPANDGIFVICNKNMRMQKKLYETESIKIDGAIKRELKKIENITKEEVLYDTIKIKDRELINKDAEIYKINFKMSYEKNHTPAGVRGRKKITIEDFDFENKLSKYYPKLIRNEDNVKDYIRVAYKENEDTMYVLIKICKGQVKIASYKDYINYADKMGFNPFFD